MANKTEIIHVAIEKGTAKLVRQQAKAQDIPVSAVIRRAINEYLSALNGAASGERA